MILFWKLEVNMLLTLWFIIRLKNADVKKVSNVLKKLNYSIYIKVLKYFYYINISLSRKEHDPD
jgi:hypothetical protein